MVDFLFFLFITSYFAFHETIFTIRISLSFIPCVLTLFTFPSTSRSFSNNCSAFSLSYPSASLSPIIVRLFLLFPLSFLPISLSIPLAVFRIPLDSLPTLVWFLASYILPSPLISHFAILPPSSSSTLYFLPRLSPSANFFNLHSTYSILN